MMKLGFTGTRDGLTGPQFLALRVMLDAAEHLTEFHHGCCVGADAAVACYVAQAYREVIVVHAHLSDLPGAFTDADAKGTSDVTHKAKPPLDRNRDIVNACDVLAACPKGPEEQRSGTWATIRYARKQKKRIVIFWPDGEVTEEG